MENYVIKQVVFWFGAECKRSVITSPECSLSKGNFVGIGFVILRFNCFIYNEKSSEQRDAFRVACLIHK